VATLAFSLACQSHQWPLLLLNSASLWPLKDSVLKATTKKAGAAFTTLYFLAYELFQ
jgi:hypothetical protein